MSNENALVSLQSFVAKARQALPKQTGKVAAYQARIDRRAGLSVIVADISLSMNDVVRGERKIDRLRSAISAATYDKLIAFSFDARFVDRLPDDAELNTNLVAALELAKSIDAGRTLVISDGCPDDPKAALAVARTFRGAIDVLYIGNEDDADAIAFMQSLAKAADGELVINDVRLAKSPPLLSSIQKLLPKK